MHAIRHDVMAMAVYLFLIYLWKDNVGNVTIILKRAQWISYMPLI